MTKINRIALAAMLLSLTVGTSLVAQRRNADAQKGGQPGQRGAAPAPVANYRPSPASPEESQAFNAIQQDPSQINKVTLADAFLTTYPNSQLAGYVQRFRMEAFTKLGKYKEAAAAGEQALNLEMKYLENMIARADADAVTAAAAAKNNNNNKKNDNKNAPPPPVLLDKNSDGFKNLINDTEQAMLYYYQNLMSNYQALNDAPKTIEWAQKALGQNPDDLLTLITLSSVMAARPPQDPKELEKSSKEAEGYAKHALDLLGKDPRYGAIPPADKANLTASLHQAIGRTYYNQKKYPEAQRSYGMALVANKKDADTYFYLGLALAQATPPRVDDAMEALAKAVFLKGATAAQADDILKKMYQNVKKSMDGYDKFIADAGAKVQ